ncbi:MAG: type I restriction endonuclease subunit R [Fimbriimonadaceae bacterium]|nr:type I restriction endonuclease subunit R [Fimbriimonadaceae bacterium]
MKQTTERAFENFLETTLAERGWSKGDLSEWRVDLGLFSTRVLSFIQDTQPELWQEMAALHGADLDDKLIATLVKELDVKGSLTVLRHGFKFYGKTFRLCYFKPAHGLNEATLALYAKNQLMLTRQVPCHPGETKTVDMVFSVNGVPVATCELKNPGSGQTWRNAIHQYQTLRDPRAPLFQFKKRALVHFAADTDEVYMTTRLAWDKTYFLPFNRGSDPGEVKCGAGNPQHPSGYRTGYLWQDILAPDSFLEILGSFIFLEKREEKVEDGQGGYKLVTREAMIFPRYHQLDSVRKLLNASSIEGPGHNYLIQHSAGSGKTNSISWLSHRLANLHNAEDKKVFDCVVVITDRQVLDRQLQDAIYQIEHAQGVVQKIDENSRQLASALVDGTKIVITTIQKFPFIMQSLLQLAGAASIDAASVHEKRAAYGMQKEIKDRTYAVIVDEAHSSQSGESAREMKRILGEKPEAFDPEEEEQSSEDAVNAFAQSRGNQPNLSFFAFTATPKGKTLELFGTPEKRAFHIYSMRQAIEEGFILDVLKNYTTYWTWTKLAKQIPDDPNVPQRKAIKKLRQFVNLHPTNIQQKTQIMVEHFRAHVRAQLGGRAKAMVVTQSRLQAVRYMEAFVEYIREQGYDDVRPLVAFSGTVKDPDSGFEYTEPGMNTDVVTGQPIGEKQLPDRFNSPDYQVLLVANKYQTGFDQPLLFAMYVDKRLDGVQAVQTLSRLNRKIPGKEAPLVLDFMNKAEDIYAAFKPYFDATSLQEESDPQALERLKHELDALQVYHWSEVEGYAGVFYKQQLRQSSSDHAAMQGFLQPAVDRFKALDSEEKQAEFRDKLKGYVNVYSFLSQILPYADADLEMLYGYGRGLLPHLPRDRDSLANFTDEVALEYYRLRRTQSGSIDLTDGEADGVRSPTAVGTSQAKEKEAPLSEIIVALNQKFATDFTEEDRLFFEQIQERARTNEQIRQTALANPFDRFQLGIRKLIEELMVERMAKNDKIVTRYMDDTDFQNTAFLPLARSIFDAIHREESEVAEGQE